MIKLFGGRLTVGKDLSQYIGRADDFYAIMQQKYGVDYAVRNRLDAYKNVVYACTSLIGEACGDYKPMLQQKKGDQWETIDHEFIRLLQNPNGNQEEAESFSQFDLFEATSIYQLLQGDCFWYMANGIKSGRPRQIIMLRADKVGTDIDPKTDQINGYFVRRSFGDPIPLEVNEVLRFNLFNPKDPFKGYGTVEAGNDYIGTDENTAKFTKNFMGNNAGLSGVLNVKGEVTKGAFRKFVRAWREKYEGVGNAGKVAILRDSDAEFTKVGLGLDELNMGELRKMTLDDVMMMFKVPMPLLGKAEQTGLGRGNVEALEYIFAKYNIDKKMKRFDSVLTFAMNRYYPEMQNIRIIHENIIPEDKENKLAERVAGVDKWITRDEVRDEDGKDSVDGGDQLFIPMANIPLDEASAGLAPTSAATDTTAGLKVKLLRTVKKKDKNLGINALKAERFRLSLMRNQLRYERQFRKVVRPIFVRQNKEALDNLEAHASSYHLSESGEMIITKDHQQKLFDDAAYDSEITRELTPMLSDLASTQGGIALAFAGDTENEFHLTSQILAKIQRGTKRMASNFNDETIARLNATLAVGIQAGEGLGELKKRVNEVYKNIDGYRSSRIARTETLKASNAATLDAYRQTGYVTGMQWAVNPNACEQCLEFDGMTVPLDGQFLALGESYTVTDDEGNEKVYTNDYDTVETPPLHPNCECTIIPVG